MPSPPDHGTGEVPALPAVAPAGRPPEVLILGVGNLLMGDEGVGIHVLRGLEADPPRAGIRLLDGGTGGINRLRELQGVAAVILVDATLDDRPAGTVSYLRPAHCGELPRGLGAHDFGLKDLFNVATLLGERPDLHLFTISIGAVVPMSLELSPAVCGAIPEVSRRIRSLAARLARP